MFRIPIVILAFVTVLGVGVAARGGELAPTVPSDIVNLRSTGATTGCGPGDFLMDVRVGPDGSGTTPFTIPAGKVFVLTGVSFRVNNGSGSTLGDSITRCVDYANGVGAFCFPATTDGSGFAGAYFTVPNLVFKAPPCFNDLGGFTPFLLGFLAPDK